MEKWVPQQKLGAFADMARYEMEKLGPGPHPDDVLRKVYGDAWDSVENRFGQLTQGVSPWNARPSVI